VRVRREPIFDCERLERWEKTARKIDFSGKSGVLSLSVVEIDLFPRYLSFFQPVTIRGRFLSKDFQRCLKIPDSPVFR
jgi:hypothetical protein